jgi:hypothetical protein
MHPIGTEFLQKFTTYLPAVTDKSEQIARQMFNVLEIAWQAGFPIAVVGEGQDRVTFVESAPGQA